MDHYIIGTRWDMYGKQFTVEWSTDDYFGHGDRVVASCPTRESRDAAFRLIAGRPVSSLVLEREPLAMRASDWRARVR